MIKYPVPFFLTLLIVINHINILNKRCIQTNQFN